MKILLAHPGTQHAFTLAEQLRERDLLYEFWTCFAISGGQSSRRALSVLPSAIRQKVENRFALHFSRRQLKTVPLLEFKAHSQLRRGRRSEEVMMERNEKFQIAIAADSIVRSDAVIGFDTSSWLLAERAHRAGKRFVLDQSHAHPQASVESARRVARDFPGWQETFPTTLSALVEKQAYEYERADVIVTASSFARETLIANQIQPEKIRLNPYGVDLEQFRPREDSSLSRPLRFVFIGALSARKGIPLLLAVWQQLRLKDAELWLLGHLSSNIHKLIPNLPGLRVFGRRLRSELINLLRACDVLVLPSYFEGFGLVLLEALACGLPIIATKATAASDLITNPLSGKIIQPGNVDELGAAMTYFVQNRGELPEMSRVARRRAEEFSWANYGDRWQKILEELA